jgi:hypothetical protein
LATVKLRPRLSGKFPTCRIRGGSTRICWMTGYCSRWYRSASSLVFQKLIARTQFGSVSDTKRVSSANPVCFFRIGSTLSLMRVARSLAFPNLVVTSTRKPRMASRRDSPLFLRQKISTGPRVPNTFAFFANVCACPPPPNLQGGLRVGWR